MKNNILVKIFDLLNQKAQYAILRNYKGLPEQSGRDIDLIIDKHNFKSILPELCNIIKEYNFRIILVDKRQYMWFIVIGTIQNDKIQLYSFDFLFHIHLRDKVLFSTKKILYTRLFNGKIYHIRLDYEFLSKYVYDRLLNEPYPTKYTKCKINAIKEYPLNIRKEISRLFGHHYQTFKDIDSTNYRTLKKDFTKQYYTTITPIKFIHHKLQYLGFIIKKLISHNGIIIAFTGPDGVGKTTIIDLITSFISKTTTVTIFHHRPSLIENISNAAHNLGIKKEIDDNYQSPHRGKESGTLNSFFRLCYYTFDYALGYWAKVKEHLLFGGCVIFDRYYTDIICDSKRSRIFLNYKFLYWFGRLFIPSLDYNILLTANTNTILSRKKELTQKDIEEINKKIDYLSTKKGYKKIFNEQTPEAAVSKILSYVFGEQHKKNLKRLKYKKQ